MPLRSIHCLHGKHDRSRPIDRSPQVGRIEAPTSRTGPRAANHHAGRAPAERTTMQPTAEQLDFVRCLGLVITEMVREIGETGTPAGMLYAGLMPVGITLSQFEKIMGALVRAGYIEQRGDCYYPKATPAGTETSADGLSHDN